MTPTATDRTEAPPWRRTLTVMVFCQVITAFGFSSIFPFLSLYVHSLGSVTSLGTEVLSGMVFSAQALTMMIASPVWGALADRWGRKIMVERAMFGGALILGLMAFVRTAEELVALRAVQGMITGTVGAANALVAAAVPRERAGHAMGLMQVGMGCGVALGPVAGGLIADAWGYAPAFYVTSALLAVAGFLVHFTVAERFTPPGRSPEARVGIWREWRRTLAAPGLRTTYCLRFLDQMSRWMFIPILPLFALALVAETARVNSFTGLVIGVSATAATLSAVFLGRVGDRFGHHRVVVASCLCGAVSYLLQTVSASGGHFLALQAAAGMANGGMLTGVSALLAVYTRGGEEGAVYGLDNSISSGARAAAPMVGASIGLWLGLRAVFGAAALFYFAAAAMALWGLPRTIPPKYTQGRP